MSITTGNGGPSTANIAIRGQTQADSLLVTDPSVAVYLNEINLQRQIGLRSAFLDVDQVQVLKGPQGTRFEIGRASCRERGCQCVLIWVVAVSLKKKKKR